MRAGLGWVMGRREQEARARGENRWGREPGQRFPAVAESPCSCDFGDSQKLFRVASHLNWRPSPEV